MRQSDALKGLHNPAHLRGIGLEKMAACRHIVEEVLHSNAGAFGCGDRFRRLHRPSVHLHLSADLFAGLPGLQTHLGHRTDGRQGFSAEAHGLNGKEVFDRRDLAGGVALKTAFGVYRVHARAVV